MIVVDYTGDYEPKRGSRYAAGYDLSAVIKGGEVVVKPGEFVKISTGIAVQPPAGYAGFLMGRSGMSKRGLRLTTGTSMIDPDYTGEIICLIYNDSDEDQKIYDGERIAQIVYVKFAEVVWNNVKELKTTKRGGGGFGSTGK